MSIFRISHGLLAVLLAGLLIGCSETTRPSQSPGVGNPATIVLVAGAGQRFVAGQSMEPMHFAVKDSSGHPVRGIDMFLRIENSSGLTDLYAPKTVTDSAGMGVFSFAVPKRAGAYTVIVTVNSAVSGRSDAFPIQVHAGAATSLSDRSVRDWMNPIAAYSGATITDRRFAAVDAYGNPADSEWIRFTADNGGRTSADSALTNADGIATLPSWTLGTDLGIYRLTVTARAARLQIADTVTSGVPTKLQLINNDQRAATGASLPQPIGVRAMDDMGRPVVGFPVTWTDLATGTVVCSGTSWYDGIASCQWTPSQVPGVYRIEATAGALKATATATVLPRPQSIEVVNGPASPTYSRDAGTVVGIDVRVRLADGSPAPGQMVLAYLDSATTDANGIAHVRWPIPTGVGMDTLWIILRDARDVRVAVAVAIVGPVRLATIAAGDAFTCATIVRLAPLGADHPVHCWGRNAEGQLALVGGSRLVPTPSPRIDAYGYPGAITAGRAHACLSFNYDTPQYREQHFVCWGANDAGQTGASGVYHSAPSAGAKHTCAVGYAVGTPTATSRIECWGDNEFGELGDGTRTSHSDARPIAAALVGSGMSVAAGTGFTCALNSDGRAFCWGRNDSGQLGIGSTVDQTTPLEVAGGMHFVLTSPITAGGSHACAIATDGYAYCWGRNDAGQLGDGTTVSRSAPTRVAGSLHFVAIEAGASHTCAITDTGAAYCWGSNSDGQLGVGSSSSSIATPTPVSGGTTFTAITAGRTHSCAIRTGDGRAFCWGSNSDGQLGDGTTVSRSVPAPVADYRP